MKVWLIALISFLIGMLLMGFVAVKFFMYGAQSVVDAEINFYTSTLSLLAENKQEQVKQRACTILPISLERYKEYKTSFWANDLYYAFPEREQKLLALAEKQLSPSGICQIDPD